MPAFYPFVKCSFQPERPKLYHEKSWIEMFFAETENLDYAMLKKFVSTEELDRSARFHFIDDRCTYVCCHAILRLMLACRLNKAPISITFEKGFNNKPYLKGNPVYFNISHTRKAFLVAISGVYTGVDVESIYKNIEPGLLMDSSFSTDEQLFIKGNRNEEKDRFFLLWTRKEAFLKAIGKGIISDLDKVIVSGQHNHIAESILPATEDVKISGEHFIYSIRIADHFLSVASPVESDLKFRVIDENSYSSLLSGLLNFRS